MGQTRPLLGRLMSGRFISGRSLGMRTSGGARGESTSDSLAPNAPTIAWDSDTSDSTPEFTVTFGPDAVATDDIVLQYADNSGFSGATELTDTLDAGEVVAELVEIITSALTDGTWYVRAKHIHYSPPGTPHTSPWSNTLTITITTSGATTAQARRSVLNLTCPWRSPIVVPDGSINQDDRQQLVYAYSKIAA